MPNGWIGKNTRRAIYDRDSILIGSTLTPVCCYCEKHCSTGVIDSSKLSMAEKKAIATLDHIVPQKDLAESSANDAEFFAKRKDPKNLVVVCNGCNSSKQHIPLFVWCERTKRDYGKILTEIGRRISIEL